MTFADDDCQRLIALIAHELRSPGAVVAGYLRLLLKNTASGLSEPERKMVEEANRSCSRLLHIAQELSELADLSSSDSLRAFTPVPIFALCDQVVQAAASAGGAVTFWCDDRDRTALVDGHAARLKQALGALVNVTLRERGPVPMSACGVISREPDLRALIVFGDDNAAANLAHVLDHQESTFDRWRGGTGLSLPIAHRIVEAHRGRLWALPGTSPRATCALSLPLAP